MKNKFIFITYALLTFSIISINIYLSYKKNIEIKQNIVEEEAKSLIALITSLRATYQEAFVNNHIPIDDKTINLLPVRTATIMSEKFAEILNNYTSIRTVSNRPRNPENMANAEELEIIEFFKANPNEDKYLKNRDTIYSYAVPLYIKKSCLKCHGSREDAVLAIKNKYDSAYDYKLGELRGIIKINMDKTKIANGIDGSLTRMIISAAVVYLLLLLFGLMLIRIIEKSEKNFTKNLERRVEEKTKELKAIKDDIEQQNKIIKQSESKFKKLINTFSGGLYINDKDYNIIYMNEPLQNIIGKEGVGEKCYKAIYNLDKKCKWCVYEELKEKKCINYDHEKDGKSLRIRNTLLDDNSKLTIYYDITERKKIERALKESEEKFKTIFKSSYAGISIITYEGVHLDTNPNCEKIHGYTREELIGQKFRDFSHSDDIEGSQKAVMALLSREKEKVELEVRLIHKHTNEIIWIHSVLTKYTKREESPYHDILVVFQDITKQKATEQALLDNEEKYRKITNSANDAVILIDNNEKIALWNITAQKIFGYTEQEILGKNLHDILPPIKLREVAHNAFALFRRSGKGNVINKTVELEGLRKDGDIFPIELSLSAIKIQDKWNAVGIIRDISMRKEHEIALKESKNKIELAHKDITDNINYAKTIQKALLSNDDIISSYLSEYFVLYKPKDQVSGDFYYINKFNKNIVFATVDSTGHGVSGGFLTVLGITYLHDIVSKKSINNTATVLNILRKKVKETFKTFGTANSNGFDMALCALNTETNILQYSGANNPLWIVRDNKLLEFKSTRNPIGFYPEEIDFTSVDIQLSKGDTIYLFSDGYADQFGGENDKKFTVKRFKDLLLSINDLPMSEQNHELTSVFNKWKDRNEQTDDVVVMGIKI